jgi:hypothetical protein
MHTPTRSSLEQLLHARDPLQPGDREDRTVGCRQSQPACCGRNSNPAVCAFARADGFCLAPPTSWKRKFTALTLEATQGSTLVPPTGSIAGGSSRGGFP